MFEDSNETSVRSRDVLRLLEPSPDRLGAGGAGKDDGPKSESLEDVAAQVDAAASAPFDLALLWQRLCGGVYHVRHAGFTSERCFVVLTVDQPNPETHRVGGRSLEILERVLRGESRKQVLFDLRISSSTVAGSLKNSLRRFGIECKPASVPVLLLMAARSAAAKQASLTAHSAGFCWDGATYLTVGVPRPERALSAALTPAELAVALKLVEGRSHAQISGARRASTRTVANQLGAVFRKLGVSGRAELLDFSIRAATAVSVQPRGEARE